MKPDENAPAAGNGQGAYKNHNLERLPHHSTTPINLLLERLENVRAAGPGYRASCPAHESKSRSTLSIRQADDGRVLLHCFSGCGAGDIMLALGLELKDLFEKPVTANMTPQQKRELREKAKMSRWKAARPELLVEIQILLLTAGQVYRGLPVNQPDMERMILAGKRIRSALGEL